jgi:hypothetical protein
MSLHGNNLECERMKVDNIHSSTLWFFRVNSQIAKQFLKSWTQRINFGINNYEKQHVKN